MQQIKPIPEFGKGRDKVFAKTWDIILNLKDTIATGHYGNTIIT